MSFDLSGSYDCQSAMLFVKVGECATSVKVTPFINQCVLQHTTKFKGDIQASRISTSALVTSQTKCQTIQTQKARFRISTKSETLACTDISTKSTSCSEFQSKHLKCGHIVRKALSLEHIECKTADVKQIESKSIGVREVNCRSLTCENAEHKRTHCTYVNAKHGLIENITTDVLNMKIDQSIEDCETFVLNSNFQWERFHTPSIIIGAHGIFAGKQHIQLPYKFQTCTPNATCFSKLFLCKDMVCESASILSTECESVQSNLLHCEKLNVHTIHCRNATIEYLNDPVPMQLNCRISNGVFQASLDSNQAHCKLPMVQQSITKDGTMIDAKVCVKHIEALHTETGHLVTTKLQDICSKDANIESVKQVLCNTIELQNDKHVLRFHNNEAYMCEVPHICLKGDTIYAYENEQVFNLTLPIKHQSFNERTYFDNLCIAEHLKCLQLKGEIKTELLSARKVARLDVNGHDDQQGNETIGFKCKNLYIDRMCTTTSHELEHLCFDGDRLLIKHADIVIEMMFPTRHYTSISDRETILESGMKCLNLQSTNALSKKCFVNSANASQVSVQSLFANIARVQRLKYDNLTFDVICVDNHNIAYGAMKSYKSERDIISSMCFSHNVLSINGSSVTLPTQNQTFKLNTTNFKGMFCCNSMKNKISTSDTTQIQKAESQEIVAQNVHCDTVNTENLTSVNINMCEISINERQWPHTDCEGYLSEDSQKLCFSEFQIDSNTTKVEQENDHIVLHSLTKHRIHFPVQNISTKDCEIFIDGCVNSDNLLTIDTSSEHVETTSVISDKIECGLISGNVIHSNVICPKFHYDRIQNQKIPKPSGGYLAYIGGLLQWLPCIDKHMPHLLLAGDRRGVHGLSVCIRSGGTTRESNSVIDGSLETSNDVGIGESLDITMPKSYDIVLVVYVSHCNKITINNKKAEYNHYEMGQMVCFHIHTASSQVYSLKFDNYVKVYQTNFMIEKIID